MAITKLSVTVLPSASIAAGGTKTAPSTGGTGGWVNTSTYYGGDLGYSITNGAVAPTAPLIITFQASPDNGVTVFDYYNIAGDLVANSVTTGTIWLDQGIIFIRAIAYNNATSAVTASANLQAISAV